MIEEELTELRFCWTSSVVSSPLLRDKEGGSHFSCDGSVVAFQGLQKNEPRRHPPPPERSGGTCGGTENRTGRGCRNFRIASRSRNSRNNEEKEAPCALLGEPSERIPDRCDCDEFDKAYRRYWYRSGIRSDLFGCFFSFSSVPLCLRGSIFVIWDGK